MSRRYGARGEAGDPWRDDPYVIPFSGGVLRNRLGLRTHHALEEAETRLAAAREVELRAAGLPRPPFSLDTLRRIHRHLFQDVYDWAGEPRTTSLSKTDDPAPFAAARDVAPRAARAFAAYAAAGDAATGPGSGRAAFVAAAAALLAEVNSVHPFREGNGRTQRLLLEAAGGHAGHPLDFRGTTRERNAVASIDAHRGRDPSGLVRLLDEAAEPRRVEALARLLRALRDNGVGSWNDLYVATTVAGQTYAGAMGGRAGDDFFVRVPGAAGAAGPGARRGDWIAVGDARDAPAHALPGEPVRFTATLFVPSGGPAPTPRGADAEAAPRARRGAGPSP